MPDDLRFRLFVQRDTAWHPSGQTTIAVDAETAVRALNPASGTRWLALNLTDQTFTLLEVRSRTETDIRPVAVEA